MERELEIESKILREMKTNTLKEIEREREMGKEGDRMEELERWREIQRGRKKTDKKR